MPTRLDSRRGAMLPLAPVVFPLTVPPVHPRGIGAVFGDADEVAALARLEHQLQVQVRVPVGPPRMRSSPRARRATPPDSHVSTRSITQRELIRKALADCPPVGQRTVRGTLTNDMMRDADDGMASEEEESDVDDDRDFE